MQAYLVSRITVTPAIHKGKERASKYSKYYYETMAPAINRGEERASKCLSVTMR